VLHQRMVDDGDAFHDFFPYLCAASLFRTLRLPLTLEASRLTGICVWMGGRVEAKNQKLVLVSICASKAAQSSKEKTTAVDLRFRTYPYVRVSMFVERSTERS
jgi:hypothetical protein